MRVSHLLRSEKTVQTAGTAPSKPLRRVRACALRGHKGQEHVRWLVQLAVVNCSEILLRQQWGLRKESCRLASVWGALQEPRMCSVFILFLSLTLKIDKLPKT